MTTKVWNGSSDAFTNAAAWSPAGVPVAGDVAVINSGTVAVSAAPTGVTIQLSQASGSTTATTLALTNVTLDSATKLIVTNNQAVISAAAPTINVSGTVTLAGTESFYGTKTQFTITAGSTLVNAGAMNFYAASPTTTGTGTLTNNGTIALVNPNGATQVPIFGTTINGTGQIALGERARIEFDGAVGSGQTLIFNNGASGNEIAQFNAIGSFGGTLNGFSQSDLLAVVVSSAYSNATYTSTGSNTGTLSLYAGSALQGSLNFIGNYTLSSFTLNATNLGNGVSNLQITTSVVNNVSAGLPSGYENGGGSTTIPTTPVSSIGAVYRFFDTRYGTHFFTSDVGERNTVIGSRVDLVQETNGFGDVASTDTSAVAVYRFFDTTFGTHFFTANSGERDTVIATRPDLAYEASSIFYEHSAQQSGDVAVYRLFDTRTGTQFLTGNQSEYNGLVTAGTSTYRSDLRSEGVAFYAPVGTFT